MLARRVLTAAALSGLLLSPPPASGAARQAEGGAPAVKGESSRLGAVVRSYDAETRTLEVLTGVGHALRLVKIPFGEETRFIEEQRATAGAGELKPGRRILIHYGEESGHRVVLAIELMNEDKTP